jgi:hypothetical protein
VRPDGSAVDHLDVAVISLGDRVHHPVPHACPSPAHEAVVTGRPRPIALGQVAPRRTRTQHPENTVQQPPVIAPWYAPRLVRQQRRDHAPFEIGQIIAAHAATLNQIKAALGIPFMGSRPSPLAVREPHQYMGREMAKKARRESKSIRTSATQGLGKLVKIKS